MMASIVGIPNFVHFDETGRALNPLNLTSVSFTVQAVVTVYVLLNCIFLKARDQMGNDPFLVTATALEPGTRFATLNSFLQDSAI